MAFISKFISSLLSKKDKSGLNIDFGKYTEDLDISENVKIWQELPLLYAKGQIFESYKLLFDYLKNPEQQNLSYKQTDKGLEFEFYQGSKIVQGQIIDNKIFAISQIASFTEQLPLSLVEFLLQENHKLRYTKFVKSQNYIAIQLEAPVSIMPPKALYQALRELAIYADSYDDVLVERYPSLQPVNIQHIIPLPDQEVKVKISYLRQWVKSTLSAVEKLSKDRYSKEQNQGLISYLLLALIYKIYYLIAPEGVLLDFLRQMDKIFWNTEQTVMKKNDYLYSSLQQLYQQDDNYLRKSLYRVKATFSVVPVVKNSKIVDFVSSELENINWLRTHYPDYYLNAAQYIIGYLNFHIALKPLHRELLDILWRILNNDFFIALGYRTNFLTRGKKLSSFNIEYNLNRILAKSKVKHFRLSKLDYSSIQLFIKSFLAEFINLLTNENRD